MTPGLARRLVVAGLLAVTASPSATSNEPSEYVIQRSEVQPAPFILLEITGDVTGDAKADAEDVQFVVNALLSRPGSTLQKSECDINRDGQLNAYDIQVVISMVLGIA